MKARAVCMILLFAGSAGCSKPADRPASTLTEAQRDSVLATEPIPGAPAVGAALRAADREAKRATAMDTLAR
jgi:hypothetical protein